MKKLFFLAAGALLVAGSVRPQKVEDELFQMLQQGRYRELVNKVCAIREKEYFKNAFMDYCLAFGYCKLNKPALSREWFDHILAAYDHLSARKRNELQELKRSCTSTGGGARPTEALFSFLRTMNLEGFQGNNSGIESKMGIPSLRDTVKELDFEHLTFDARNRKFTLQQKQEALAYFQTLLAQPAFKADTTEHFLVFYPNNATAIGSQMKQLEQYYAYYNQVFNLNRSSRLITIFYCTSRNEFNLVAQRVHRLAVPSPTFGYASSTDLVMLGIASTSWLGAMKHELFHLMIRAFLGDIPPWLDEGTACYFENSSLSGNRITTNFSAANYRYNLLRNRDEVRHQVNASRRKELKIPSVKQLTNYNWQEFSGTPGDLMIQASYHQSLSYAFVTYLSEKELLVKTIRAFQNRAYTENAVPEAADGLTLLHLRTTDDLLRQVTGKSQEALQADFLQWCSSKNINVQQ